jgi:hypothetical protein
MDLWIPFWSYPESSLACDAVVKPLDAVDPLDAAVDGVVAPAFTAGLADTDAAALAACVVRRPDVVTLQPDSPESATAESATAASAAADSAVAGSVADDGAADDDTAAIAAATR